MKAGFLQHASDAGEELIVAAAAPHQPDNPQPQADAGEVRPDLPDGRSQDAANEDQVPAALGLQQALDLADLAEVHPSMGKAFDLSRIGPAAHGNKKDASATPDRSIGDNRGKVASAANDRERRFLAGRIEPVLIMHYACHRRFRAGERGAAASAPGCRRI